MPGVEVRHRGVVVIRARDERDEASLGGRVRSASHPVGPRMSTSPRASVGAPSAMVITSSFRSCMICFFASSTCFKAAAVGVFPAGGAANTSVSWAELVTDAVHRSHARRSSPSMTTTPMEEVPAATMRLAKPAVAAAPAAPSIFKLAPPPSAAVPQQVQQARGLLEQAFPSGPLAATVAARDGLSFEQRQKLVDVVCTLRTEAQHQSSDRVAEAITQAIHERVPWKLSPIADLGRVFSAMPTSLLKSSLRSLFQTQGEFERIGVLRVGRRTPPVRSPAFIHLHAVGAMHGRKAMQLWNDVCDPGIPRHAGGSSRRRRPRRGAARTKRTVGSSNAGAAAAAAARTLRNCLLPRSRLLRDNEYRFFQPATYLAELSARRPLHWSIERRRKLAGGGGWVLIYPALYASIVWCI
jgi:hypothetical protein